MIAAAIFLWLSAKDDHSASRLQQTQRHENQSTTRVTVRDFVDADGTRLQSRHRHCTEHLRRLSLEFVGRRGRVHSRPRTHSIIEFSGPRRHRHFPFYSHRNGLDGNSRARRQRSLRARRSQDRDIVRRRRYRSARGRAYVKSGRRQSNHSGTGDGSGFCWAAFAIHEVLMLRSCLQRRLVRLWRLCA
jgi:hypothetical protein